jgi:phosphatidylglycerol---prolipoprotein diacylglyceryl transferase
MYPVIHIGPATTPTAFVALIAALWVGTTMVERECKRCGLAARSDDAWTIVMLAAAVAMVTARIVYVGQNLPAYASDWTEIFSLTPSTLSLDYGSIFGLVAAYAYVQHRQIPLARIADAFAPGALVALAIFAFGQFLSGDAYGATTNVPWAIDLYGETRHPVQLYDAIAALVGFVIVWRLARRQMTDGLIALFATAGYSATRVFVDAFRGDAAVLAGGYRISQVIALIVLVFALWMMPRLETRKDARLDFDH